MTRRLLLVIAVGAAAVACSDGSDRAGTATSTPAAAEATEETDVATTTTSTEPPATSTAPTTTTAPATTTTTVPSTTSTTLDLESLLTPEAVIAAAEEADAVFVECGLQLPNCDPSVFDETHTGPQLSQVVSQVTQEIAANIRIRNTEPRRLVVTSVEFEGADSGDQDQVAAITDECIYDETVVFRVRADGTEEIVDTAAAASVVVRRDSIDLGRWKLTNSERTARLTSADSCP